MKPSQLVIMINIQSEFRSTVNQHCLHFTTAETIKIVAMALNFETPSAINIAKYCAKFHQAILILKNHSPLAWHTSSTWKAN